jgi:amino acid transporter
MGTASNSPTMTLESARSTDDLGLVRGIGRWDMVALMINGIIGAGIFGLPSRIHSLVGPWGLLAFVACALVVACMALCFAEVSSRFTLTGGPYLYTQQAFGPLAGFLIGWLLWITRLTALAAIGSVMASYLAFFWTPAAAGSSAWGFSSWTRLVSPAPACRARGRSRRRCSSSSSRSVDSKPW